MKTKLAAMTAGLMLLTTAAYAETVWDMHINFPVGNFDTKNALRFAEETNKVTNGEVTINVIAGGALGLKGPEVMGAVRDGIVSVAHFHLDTAIGDAPFLGIQGLPYLTRGFDDAERLNELAQPTYDKIAQQNNQKILYSVFWPGAHLYTKEPANSIEDLASQKIRTANKPSTDFLEKAGAAPVLMPWADALVALASGGLDGIATSATSGVDGKFWEFMGAVKTISYVNPTAVVAVNLDSWNELSEENQKAISDLATKLEGEFRAVAEDEDKTRLEQLAENGMDVSAPSEEFSTALKTAAEAQWGSFAESAGGEASTVLDAYLAERN